ncbi:MAG: hypothetical protein EOM59_21895 [Clostridia bacterium]|nr:hypothetical protein [Clostridia bacterium]
MNVLIIDIDSKIPNLALMKISAYHKSIGDDVGFHIGDPDKIYASVIFKKNKHLVDGLQLMYPDAEIDIGGCGYDLKKKLPDYIENIMPDYSLYDTDTSYGFSTRGCIRNCYFCIVPKKEGKIHRTQHPKEWHDPSMQKITFLDNNILADKERFIEVTDWAIENNLKVDFLQGLDIRLLDSDIANRLKKLKFFKPIKFAFDHDDMDDVIEKGIDILVSSKINVRHNALWYVYVDSDDQYESGLRRCNLLKQWNTTPFVMFNCDNKPTKRIRILQRWANLPWIFWSCDIEDYRR